MKIVFSTRYFGCLAAFLGGVLVLGVSMPVAVQAQGAQAEAPADAELSGESLGPRQKIDFAAQTEKELGAATAKVLRLIEDAQRKKDIILLNCLNDKLAALRALLKVAGDSRLNLAEAVARENLDLQEHNFRKVYIAKQQGVAVAAEADACVGQVGIVSTGQTRVVVSVEGGSSEGDTSFGAAAGGSSRPPDASPFRDITEAPIP